MQTTATFEQRYQERKYRLRIGDRIVGYARVSEARTFYSKDFYWWTGEPLAYEQRDEIAAIRDGGNTPLFAGDIVSYADRSLFGRKMRTLEVSVIDGETIFRDVRSNKKVVVRQTAGNQALCRIGYSFGS